MKTYRIDVKEDFYGFLEGTLDVKANSKKAAINKLKKMSSKKVEKLTHWTSSDLYTTEVRSYPESIIEL